MMTAMRKIALIGNPNSGKSSVFNHLTGLRQKVANFPGVTVEKKVGKMRLSDGEEVTIVDFPGAYSLYPTSEDERVVLRVLANPDDEDFPDVAVYIADVTHLEKHLLLFTQLIDLGIPTILALNMSDLAGKEGLEVKTEALERVFGTKVLNISGRTGQNVAALKSAIGELLRNPAPATAFYEPSENEKKIISAVKAEAGVSNDYHALLLAHHHQMLPSVNAAQKEAISTLCEASDFPSLRLQIDETMARFRKLGGILQKAMKRQRRGVSLTDKIDRLLTHRVFAPLIFFIIMFFVFQAIYAWAEMPMNWIENGFAALSSLVKETLPAGWFTDLLTEGIITGLGGILVFVPQIAILFFLITLLEEVGYMARAVFIFDKLMQQFGMNGRSVVALISGGACAVPAIMSTRTIGVWKERLITILVTPLISCSARIPVYTVLIGFVVPEKAVFGLFNLQGLAFMGLYLLGIVMSLLVALVFKYFLKSTSGSWLMMELPSYKMPDWLNVWQTIKEKTGAFIWEAGKVIMMISIVLWALASYGPAQDMQQAETLAEQHAAEQNLDEQATADLLAAYKIEASYAGHLGKFLEPAIEPLGFDWKIGIALITSFAAREVFVATMATIYSIGSAEDEVTIHDRLSAAVRPGTGEKVYTPATALSLLIFYVFALQCMSTLAVVKRETGSWKWPLLQFLFMGLLAYLGSLITYQMMG